MGVERRIYGSYGKRASGYEWASKGEYKDLKERGLQDMIGHRKDNIGILRKDGFRI
jgi:hypothetical protein